MATATVNQAALPDAVSRRGIDEFQWRTLTNSLFPGAATASVLSVIDYCRARHLDPLKKPCHIVPMRVKVGGEWTWRDVVMPGIYEYRTTAQRTGEYLGHSKPEYGPFDEQAGVEAPIWCEFTVYRWNGRAQQRVEFPVRVWFEEVVALKDGKANDRWSRAPIQMLTKCAEAAALREAFPEELGGEQTFEEMDGQRAIDAPVIEAKQITAKPEGYDYWLLNLTATADNGEEALSAMFGSPASEPMRAYLTSVDNSAWEALKVKAGSVEAQS